MFRTIATTLVLGGLGAQLASIPTGELSRADLASFGIIGFSYVLTLVTGLLIRRSRVGVEAAWVQIVFDVMLAASVVFLTGGSRSPFSFLFLVSIVGAAVLLGTRGAVIGFLGAASAYLGVLAIVPSSLATSDPVRFALDLFIQLLAQLLIAVLSGYVGEQLTRTGGRLDASEREVKQLTELQNEIVSAMPSGLITCDSVGAVTFLNPAAASILGVSAESVVGQRDIESLFPQVTGLVVARRHELKVQTPRGERTLGLSVATLPGARGLLVVFQDLTELRRVEQELDKIDHLATLGRLSAQLAHEIRNPLAAMRGSAQLLAGDSASAPQHKLANVIVREADRLAGLVEGYLDLARPPRPQLVPTRLDHVVHETLELLRADPSFLGVRVEEELEPVEAACDASQVKQVLINLLRNAAAAITSRSGSIRIRVKAGPLIEVWDSAGSIAPEDRQRIFDPFFSRSRGGSGLGLSTVSSIVQAHGGTITVDSNPEAGTTFSVTLRALDAPTLGTSSPTTQHEETHVAHSGR
ncbi:MAG: PAS domain-containing protein [Archangium sp.]|nr:PAS domain-containing protein [Archangium sp.]